MKQALLRLISSFGLTRAITHQEDAESYQSSLRKIMHPVLNQCGTKFVLLLDCLKAKSAQTRVHAKTQYTLLQVQAKLLPAATVDVVQDCELKVVGSNPLARHQPSSLVQMYHIVLIFRTTSCDFFTLL